MKNQFKYHVGPWIPEYKDLEFFLYQLQNKLRGALDPSDSKCERIFQKYPFPPAGLSFKLTNQVATFI